eukprot:270000_1
MCDILILPLSMIGLISPTRFVKAFYLWWNFLRCKCCGYKQPDWDEFWSVFETVEYNIEFRLKAIKNSIYGIIDLLCIIIGCITFIFISLHRIPCFCRCIGLLFDTITNKKRKEKYYKMKEYNIWLCIAFINVFISFTDLFIFIPLFLIAFITHPISSIKSFGEFAINWDPKDAQHKNENLSQHYRLLIRYNWSLRTQFFYLALFGVFDVLSLLISIPSILLRPFAFGRICKIFWLERWRTIEVDSSNRFKIYTACILNVIYECIDFFCILIFLIDCILLIRLYHVCKSWINMLKSDKVKYNRPRPESDTGQDVDAIQQQPEVQLQPNMPSLNGNYNNKNNQKQYDIEHVNTQYILRFNVPFRMTILKELMWTFIDWATVLLTIPAIIIPTRFFAFWYILYRGKERYKNDTYHLEIDKSLYKPLFINLWYGITDLIIIPIGILCIILPTRLPTMLYLWIKFIVQCITTMPCCWSKDKGAQEQPNEENKDNIVHSEYYDIFVLKAKTQKTDDYAEMRYNKEFRICLLWQLYFGVFDIFAIIIGFPS